jgi:nucleotide-binding universal stress UspA family protein
MFKQILVPLDGSTRAEQALPIAARLARASSGTVTLVQAVSPPSKFMEVVGEIVLPEVLDENVPAAKEYLGAVAQTSSLEGVRTATQVMIGHPAREIIAAAQADNADLVVLCSHGYTGFMHWSMGSIAEKVARHAPSPVLILHEGGALSTGAGVVPHGSIRVLVPLDSSEYAEAALLPAALLACAFSAPARGELHLTRVVSSPEESSSHEEAERARQYLHLIIERLQQHPLTEAGVPLALSMTWSVTVAHDVATGIIQAAESSGKREDAGRDAGCQVIAMATQGLGGPQLWALGSTTERVLQAARQPLLIVHR